MSDLLEVVALFGTCGDSTWREDIAIPLLKKANVEFFNPVITDREWVDADRINEAKHAASDKVVLLVITDETTGIGSMGESGWLALQAAFRGQKTVIVLQDIPIDGPQQDDQGNDLRINKARDLIRKHIAKLPSNVLNEIVFLCDDVEEATRKAIELIQA